MEASDFEIASIHVISKAESKKIHLLAVTTTGYRLYFTHHRDALRSAFVPTSPESPPNALELVHVRLPPPAEASGPGLAMQGQQSQNGKLHKTFYNRGALLAARYYSGSGDTLLAIAADYAEQDNYRPAQPFAFDAVSKQSRDEDGGKCVLMESISHRKSLGYSRLHPSLHLMKQEYLL